MPGPVALPGLNDANPIRQNTAIRQISERLEADYAPLDSPVFVGDPQAPTPVLTDNDTSIATTAYVQGQNYTTKTYVDAANATQDTAIAGKAALVHTHAQSDVTGLVSALAGKEPTIAAGTSSQYWRGDKTFQDFPAQRLIASYSDVFATLTNLTVVIPVDNTPPLITEGAQLLSRNVTTTSSTQRIDIWVQMSGMSNSGAYTTIALFAGSTLIGAAMQEALPHSGWCTASYTPGAAGTYTISMRVGPVSGTTTINNYWGGTIGTVMLTNVIEP